MELIEETITPELEKTNIKLSKTRRTFLINGFTVLHLLKQLSRFNPINIIGVKFIKFGIVHNPAKSFEIRVMPLSTMNKLMYKSFHYIPKWVEFSIIIKDIQDN